MPTGTLVIPPPHVVLAGFPYGPDGSWVGTLGATSSTPDVEEAVYARLAADESIRAVVGSRIYPDVADADAPRPLLVYFLQSSGTEESLDADGLEKHSVAVVSEGLRKDDTRALAALVKTCLHRQVWDGVKRAYWSDEAGDETDDGFGVLQTYTVIQ